MGAVRQGDAQLRRVCHRALERLALTTSRGWRAAAGESIICEIYSTGAPTRGPRRSGSCWTAGGCFRRRSSHHLLKIIPDELKHKVDDKESSNGLRRRRARPADLLAEARSASAAAWQSRQAGAGQATSKAEETPARLARLGKAGTTLSRH